MDIIRVTKGWWSRIQPSTRSDVILELGRDWYSCNLDLPPYSAGDQYEICRLSPLVLAQFACSVLSTGPLQSSFFKILWGTQLRSLKTTLSHFVFSFSLPTLRGCFGLRRLQSLAKAHQLVPEGLTSALCCRQSRTSIARSASNPIRRRFFYPWTLAEKT